VKNILKRVNYGAMIIQQMRFAMSRIVERVRQGLTN
jgi:uncharacterized protein (DUF433 family)